MSYFPDLNKNQKAALRKCLKGPTIISTDVDLDNGIHPSTARFLQNHNLIAVEIKTNEVEREAYGKKFKETETVKQVKITYMGAVALYEKVPVSGYYGRAIELTRALTVAVSTINSTVGIVFYYPRVIETVRDLWLMMGDDYEVIKATIKRAENLLDELLSEGDKNL